MASATKRTQLKRKRKTAAQGGKRKAALRNKGTTKPSAKLFGDEK